jgi:hypothetical protein
LVVLAIAEFWSAREDCAVVGGTVANFAEQVSVGICLVGVVDILAIIYAICNTIAVRIDDAAFVH